MYSLPAGYYIYVFFAGSFVIKLFDRSVDLTKFNEDMSLYPICRAWMNNYPLKTNKKKTLEGQKNSDDVSSSFIHL